MENVKEVKKSEDRRQKRRALGEGRRVKSEVNKSKRAKGEDRRYVLCIYRNSMFLCVE